MMKTITLPNPNHVKALHNLLDALDQVKNSPVDFLYIAEEGARSGGWRLGDSNHREVSLMPEIEEGINIALTEMEIDGYDIPIDAKTDVFRKGMQVYDVITLRLIVLKMQTQLGNADMGSPFKLDASSERGASDQDDPHKEGNAPMFRYTAVFTQPRSGELLFMDENMTLSVVASDLMDAVKSLSAMTCFDNEDEQNFKIIKVEQI